RKQIKKQRRQSGVVECAGHKLIPRTVTAASATVRKKHERTRALRKMQISRENCSPGLNLHFNHLLRLVWVHSIFSGHVLHGAAKARARVLIGCLREIVVILADSLEEFRSAQTDRFIGLFFDLVAGIWWTD